MRQETVYSHTHIDPHNTLFTHLSLTPFSPHSELPESSLQPRNPAEGHKLNPVSTLVFWERKSFPIHHPTREGGREREGENE